MVHAVGLDVRRIWRSGSRKQAPPRPPGRVGENLFRGLVEAAPIPMLVITADAQGRVLLMNARFSRRSHIAKRTSRRWWTGGRAPTPIPLTGKLIRRTWIEAMTMRSARGSPPSPPRSPHG